MKSKLLLLDANVVIEAYKLNLWKTLYTQYEISLPSVVLQKEVQFFKSNRNFGANQEIKLQPLVDAGQIHEVAATNDDIDQLSKRFKATFFEVLGHGELEALALLVAGKLPDMRFSTADGPAIKALGALCIGFSGVSFEELLSEIGQSNHIAKLPKHFKKTFFETQLRIGRTESQIILSS